MHLRSGRFTLCGLHLSLKHLIKTCAQSYKGEGLVLGVGVMGTPSGMEKAKKVSVRWHRRPEMRRRQRKRAPGKEAACAKARGCRLGWLGDSLSWATGRLSFCGSVAGKTSGSRASGELYLVSVLALLWLHLRLPSFFFFHLDVNLCYFLIFYPQV